MKPERILALDVSTKTGWAAADITATSIKLLDYGTLEQIHQPDGGYPSNYVIWAHLIFTEIDRLIDKYDPLVLVIEETSKGSKNAMSQKILEFTHFLLASYIKESAIKSVYIMTEVWRRELGCVMNDKEKAKNKEVREYKKKFEKKNGKKTTIAYDINGKRIGLTGKKHVNVRRMNEIYGDQLREPLKLVDEDQADALGLAAAYHQRRLKTNGDIKEMTIEEIVREQK